MESVSPKLLLHPVYAPALGFGAGLSPRAPGTAGTLVGVPVCLLLQWLPWYGYATVLAVLFGLGVWLCGATARALQAHDHPAIVWDEIVGYLAVMLLAPPGPAWLLTGFVLFRLFDIWKPWPVRLLDRHVGGGMGIMLDDLAAALYGWIFMQFFHILYAVNISS